MNMQQTILKYAEKPVRIFIEALASSIANLNEKQVETVLRKSTPDLEDLLQLANDLPSLERTRFYDLRKSFEDAVVNRIKGA